MIFMGVKNFISAINCLLYRTTGIIYNKLGSNLFKIIVKQKQDMMKNMSEI